MLHGVICTSSLICGDQLAQWDSGILQEPRGVPHGLLGQNAGPGQDPGIVHVEEAQEVCAGVHHGHAGVVRVEHPVCAPGRQERETDSEFGGFFWVRNCRGAFNTDPILLHLFVEHLDGSVRPQRVVGFDALPSFKVIWELRDLKPPAQVPLQVEVRLNAHFRTRSAADVLSRRQRDQEQQEDQAGHDSLKPYNQSLT